MKVFVMLYLFIFTGMANASNCDALKNDLLAVENKLQNSCINTDSEGNCCEPCDVPGKCTIQELKRNCVKKKDVFAKYNSKLAELIIAEGIQSLRLGISNNYNALNDLTKAQIKDADKKVKDLTKSLKRADLLYWALFSNNNNDGGNLQGQKNVSNHTQTLFAGYQQGVNLEKLLTKRCASLRYSALRFCEKFKDYKTKEPDNYLEFLSTLDGFLKADDYYVSNEDTRIERFSTYRDKLKIKITNKETGLSEEVTPDEFLSNTKGQHFQNVINLRDNLNKLKNKSLPAADRKVLVDQVLKQANALDKINMHYKPLGSSQYVYQKDTLEYLKTSFDDTLEQLELPSLVVEGDFRKHFENSAKRVNADFKRHAQAMKKLYSEVGCTNFTCLENKCKPGQNISNLNACTELEFFKEHKQAETHIRSAKSCLEDKGTNPEKVGCLESIETEMCKNTYQLKTDQEKCLSQKKDNTLNIKTIKKELAQLEGVLNAQNSTKLSKVLNMKKAMGIKALQLNSCVGHGPGDNISGVYDLDCGRSSDLGQDKRSYEFSLNGVKIGLSLNDEQVKENLKTLGRDGQLKGMTDAFVKNCKSGQHSSDSICKYYKDKEAWNQSYDKAVAARKKKMARKRRKRELKNAELDRLEAEENNYTKQALSQFLVSTATYMTTPLGTNSLPYIGIVGQTSLQNSQRKAFKEDLRFQTDQLTNNLRRLAEQQNQNQVPANFIPTNFGTSQLGTQLGDYQTFQAANQSTAFRGDGPFQMRFAPIQNQLINTNDLLRPTVENRQKKLPDWQKWVFLPNKLKNKSEEKS